MMSCFGSDEEHDGVLFALQGPCLTNAAVLHVVSFLPDGLGDQRCLIEITRRVSISISHAMGKIL